MIGTALLLVLVAVAPAEIFRRLGPARVPELNNGLYRWENAYRTTMTINGRPSEMRLYSVRFSEPVVDQLVSRFEALGAKVTVGRSVGGAAGVASWPDKEARFLVISPEGEPRHLVFVFYPQPGSKPASVDFPVPKYTGGKVEYTVSDDDTGTFFATISTLDSATAIHSYYTSAMAAEGWSQVSPPVVAGGRVSGMALYRKNKKICYVQAVDRPGRGNMVTLLVKGGKL